ncbi:MAG: hypothetical protein E2590_13335, partial [Chryseobacterium sp.]|nr:hypothetical protein [Chryseobacterium sp.]
MRKRLQVFILFFGIFINIEAQLSDENFLPNIIPPSPEAYSLGKYGNSEIGEFTGSPNINIPLFNFISGGISSGISLSYTSNGLKVDEKEGDTGLGWDFIAGGVINRVVRGKDDFTFTKLQAPENFENGASNPAIAQFFYDGGNKRYDTEDDLFSFSAGELSGQFIINEKNGISFLSKSDVKVDILIDDEYEPYFLLTDDKGIKYYFTAKESNFTKTGGAPPSPLSITAWYLTKIKNPTGEEIIFEYDNYDNRYFTSESQTLSYSDPWIQYDCEPNNDVGTVMKVYSHSPQKGNILSHEIQIAGKKIKKIYSNRNNSIIKFERLLNNLKISKYDGTKLIEEISLNLASTSNNRTFLNSISSSTGSKDYQFEYIQPDSFPKRLSKSQDHWGYFNGKSNVNIVPKNLNNADNLNNIDYNGADKEPDHSKSIYGLLRKVVYPTKGYTTLEYEPHSYYGTVRELPTTKTFYLPIVVKQGEVHISETGTIKPGFDQTIKMTAYGNFNSIDCPSSYNQGTRHVLILKVRDSQNQLIQLSKINSFGFYEPIGNNELHSGQAKDYYFFAKKDETYTVELFSNWQCTQGSVSFNYYDEPYTEIDKNLITGGNRVHKIIDVDNGQQQVKKYYYAQKTNLNRSSGSKGLDPNYRDFRKWEGGCDNPVVLRDAVVSSSSLFPLFDSGKSNIYYKYVTTSLGGDNFERGFVEKEFYINRDYWGNQLFGSENVSSAPWTNFGWNNGYLKFEKYVDETNKTLKTVENVWTNRNQTNNKSYYIRKNYTFRNQQNPVYNCNSDDITRPNNGTYWECTTNHTHWYDVGNWGKCLKGNANNIERSIVNLCYQKPLNYQLIHYFMLSNLDVVEYNNISYQKFLEKKIVTDYINDTPSLVTTTEYFYNNPAHYQLTDQKTTFPDSTLQETTY